MVQGRKRTIYSPYKFLFERSLLRKLSIIKFLTLHASIMAEICSLHPLPQWFGDHTVTHTR